MGTRSRIGYESSTGHIASVYCHWDGYPSHVGKILLENYNSITRAVQLMIYGDISTLHASMEKPAGHSYDTPVEGHTVFYARDRNEKDVESQTSENREEFVQLANECGAEFIYLLTKNGKWTYRSISGARFLPLTERACNGSKD